MNQRLAMQLKKRQTDLEVNVNLQKQKRLYSNSVIDQPKLNWPDFMDLQDYANPIFRLELLLAT